MVRPREAGDEGMDGAAHQIRQRQVRVAHVALPLGVLRLAGADLHPHGASSARMRRGLWGVRGGTAPRQPPPGDTRSVATGSMLALPMEWTPPPDGIAMCQRWY